MLVSGVVVEGMVVSTFVVVGAAASGATGASGIFSSTAFSVELAVASGMPKFIAFPSTAGRFAIKTNAESLRR
jgi:hypothetical protein